MEHKQSHLDNFQQRSRHDTTSSQTHGDNSSRAGKKQPEFDLDVSVVTEPGDFEQDWLNFERRLNSGHANSNWALAWYAAHRQEGGASAYILVGRNAR